MSGMLLVGCGSAKGPEASSGSRATVASPASSAPHTSEPPASTEPAYRILSADELNGALLGIEDLPPGYSQDPPEDNNTNKTFCDYTPPFLEQVKVRRDFTKGGGLSAELVSLGVRQYATPEEAKASFDAMTTALASCPGETYQGSKMTYTPMSAPKVGDASVGIKVNIDGTDVLQTFALVGPAVINTGGGGLMNANADEVLGLLDAQVNSYVAAAAG